MRRSIRAGVAIAFAAALAGAAAVPQTISVTSYNIMNGGFGSLSGKYDPEDRVPGNLTNYVAAHIAPNYGVLGIIEAKGWDETAHDGHPNISTIAKSWGYAYYWHSGNELAFLSHDPITLIEVAGGTACGAAVAEINGITYIVTCLGDYATSRLAEGRALAQLVRKYADRPLLVMGDFNGLSPQDVARYDATSLCASNEENYCLKNATGELYLETGALQAVLDAGLTDLCWIDGDSDGHTYPARVSLCPNTNPTLTIHWWLREGRAHAVAKIDYIFANAKLLLMYRLLHSRVMADVTTDAASDHYPIEAYFERIT